MRGVLSVCYSDDDSGGAMCFEGMCRDVGNWGEMMNERMTEYE